MTKGILFDLDGVLIDSEGTYTEFWREVDRRHPTGIENFAIAIKGTTLPAILELFPDENVKEEICRELHKFQDEMVFRMFPDTMTFLENVKKRGLRCAIVTSSDARKMERLYSQHPEFRNYFEAIIDASQVSKSKPDPEGYLKAASALRLSPEECCVMEDSLQGLKAARASGARVVAMATTYPAERLHGLADAVVNSLTEALDAIK